MRLTATLAAFAATSLALAQEPVLSVQWSPDGQAYALAYRPIERTELSSGLSWSLGPVGGLRLRDGVPVAGLGLGLTYDRRSLSAGIGLNFVAAQGGPVAPVVGLTVGFRL